MGCAGSVGAGTLVCVCGVSLDQIKLLSSNRRLAGPAADAGRRRLAS